MDVVVLVFEELFVFVIVGVELIVDVSMVRL